MARLSPIPLTPTPAAGRIMTTAADFVRQFGQWSRSSTHEPLYVTHHGRPTHVMLSVPAFEAMRIAPRRDDLGTARLAEWIDDGLLVCAGDCCVTLANEAAHGICARPAGTLRDRTLWDALPQLAATVFGALVRRALAAGEPGMADMPSPFRADRWLRLRVRPLDDGAAILLRDVTDQVREQTGADERRALADALAAQPAIGWVRLSPRGHIGHASAPFCAMIGLPEARLREVALADLAARSARVALRAWMDAAWRDHAAPALETSLVGNDGMAIAVRASIAAISGPYVADGAIILFDRLD